MRRLHLEKKGIRGLAVAESFAQDSKKSVLAGVVMRRDFVIDGFVFGDTTVAGDDATQGILKMYERLSRPDISYLLISGIIISMYNMIDVKKIHQALGIPVIGVTYGDSGGIGDAIRRHFPDGHDSKIRQYENLKRREKISLHTSCDLYVRREGCAMGDARRLLDELTLQGGLPEPLRIAQLLARTLLNS